MVRQLTLMGKGITMTHLKISVQTPSCFARQPILTTKGKLKMAKNCVQHQKRYPTRRRSTKTN